MENKDEDDDIPQLSAETFGALQEFYKEQEQKEQIVNELTCSLENGDNTNNIPNVSEDWQLSQFWYDDETALSLAKEVVRLTQLVGKDASVACISCPTLYTALKKHFPSAKLNGEISSYLFHAFSQIFGYRKPL